MTGSRVPRTVLQPRDRLALKMLGELRVATWKHIAALAGFGSRTRTSSRLALLDRAGYVRRTQVGTLAGGRQTVFSLPRHRLPAWRGPAGTEAAIAHQLLVNDIRVAFTKPQGPAPPWTWWQPESLLQGLLEPDGAILSSAQTRRCFLIEADRGTEGPRVWQRKVERYLILTATQEISVRLGVSRFGVLVVGETPQAVNRIRRVVREKTEKLFWFTTISQLINEGSLAPIWQRPVGDQPVPLIKETNEILPNM